MTPNLDAIRLADAIEAAAYRDLYAGAPSDFARAAKMRTDEIGGATVLIAPSFPAHTFNRVIGLGLQRPTTEKDLDSLIATFRGAGSHEFWIHWSPAAQPAESPRWLEARGFSFPKRRSWAKLLRGRQAPPEIKTSLDIRRANSGDADHAAAVICTAFGMPPDFAGWFSGLAGRARWTCYVATSGDRIVGAAWLYVDGASAWLGIGGMLPEFRNRGGQGALMARRIGDAIAAGCTHIVTETGEPIGDEPNPSLRNMHRCGFEQVCSRLNYSTQI